MVRQGWVIWACVALSAGALALAAPARAADNRGREFWFAFPQNHTSVRTATLTVAVTAQTVATATVSVPGLQFNQTLSLAAGQPQTVTVPGGAELTESNSVLNLGVLVKADADVSVVAMSAATNSTDDAFLALPTPALGTEYLNLSYPTTSLHGDGGTQLAVVGTQPGTAVTITPSVATDGHPAGTPYTITLEVGDAYLLQNRTAGADLSGTAIRASKPVAVIGGQRCANIPVTAVACDFTAEDLPPVSSWGWRFATVPLASRIGGDTYRVMAAENGTTLRLNGAPVATLDRGGVFERILTAPAQWTADRPVVVMQYANGGGFDQTVGDPSQLIVPPLNGYAKDPAIWVPAGFTSNFVNLVVRSADASSVLLDGTGRGLEFTAIGQSGLAAATVTVGEGGHRISAASPIGVHVYGFGAAVSYGYPAGLDTTPAAIALTPDSVTPTIHTQNCVTAAVVPGSPGAAAGAAVVFAVSGANRVSSTQIAGSDGRARFCYTGANLGADTVRASASSASATTTTTWVRAVSAVRLDPPAGTSTVGEQRCVTATAFDQDDRPFDGVRVDFSVGGANAASGGGNADQAGQAAFCYAGPSPGEDAIRATAGGVSATAAATWVVRVARPPEPPDRDKDGVPDARDNCPDDPNASQADEDDDQVGDACEILPPGNVPVVAGTNAVVKVEQGEVFIKLPPGAKASHRLPRARARASQAAPLPGFVPIKGVASVPFGSTIDARKGTLTMTTADDARKGATRRRLSVGSFSAALFRIRQARARRGAKTAPPAELALQTPPGSARACAANSRVRPIKGVVRSLSGASLKGVFRTAGAASTTTTKGRSNWLVQDTCTGTLTQVGRGKAIVRDLKAHRTVAVRAGQGYYARARLFAARARRGRS